MSSGEKKKSVARMRQRKQTSAECLETKPLKKKRGRKPRSLSPSPPSPVPFSFFKVLIGDFKDVLFIPPLAACTLKGLAKKYVVIEDVDGKFWNVKISIVDGSLAFQNGWHDFVSDHSITVGEFVLFTYSGGLLFTARIFGTSALERTDFQIKRRKGRCAKEICTTELKLVDARIPKRPKISQASEEKHYPFRTKVLRSLKTKRTSVKCGFPKVHVIDSSDSISEGAQELSSATKKPRHDSNSRESDIALHDSEQTWHRNSDATVGELKLTCPTELVNSNAEDIDPVARKSIRKGMQKTEKGTGLMHSSGTLPLKQTAEEPHVMTKTATWAVEVQSDIKEGSAEMSGSLAQMDKEHDEVKNNGKIEQGHSHELEMLDHEAHDDKMTSLSNMEHAECSPKMEFNLFKTEVIAEAFLSADGTCHTNVDENVIELATGASLNTNGQEEPPCQNDHEAHDDKMASQSNCENAECSPKMEFNLIKTEGIAEVFLSADGICHTNVDENLIELATGACLNTNGQEEPPCQNDHEAHDDKMTSLSNCEHAECSPKIEFNLIKTEGIAEVFLSADGICHINVDENLIELATGASFNTNGQEESSCQNDHKAHDDKMTSLSNCEHAECSPKMEFNLIKTEGIAEVFLSADGICHTNVDENLIELATGAIFNTNGQEESPCQNDHEAHDDKITSLCNCEHAECSPKLEFNLIKTEGIAEFFFSADGICYSNVDENLIGLATGASFNTNGQKEPPCQNDHAAFGSRTSVPCETISVVSSNLTLDHLKDKKETLMSVSEEYGVPQTKGIAHDEFFDEDEKKYTPCSSQRCMVKIDTTDSADIIPSSSVSFSVCLSDDVQSFLDRSK